MVEERLTLWQRAYKKLTTNRIERMHMHYTAVCDELSFASPKDEAEALFFREKFARYHRFAVRTFVVHLISGIFLYASILVGVLKVIPVFSFLVTFIQVGSSVFGGIIAIVVFFWTRVRLNLYLDLMGQCLMHLVALYQRNPKRNTKKALNAINRMM